MFCISVQWSSSAILVPLHIGAHKVWFWSLEGNPHRPHTDVALSWGGAQAPRRRCWPRSHHYMCWSHTLSLPNCCVILTFCVSCRAVSMWMRMGLNWTIQTGPVETPKIVDPGALLSMWETVSGFLSTAALSCPSSAAFKSRHIRYRMASYSRRHFSLWASVCRVKRGGLF